MATDKTQEKVVELLNQASLYGKDSVRVSQIKQIQEFVIRKEPTLLDNFLDEILAFQNDRSPEMRKAIIGFIEEACKHDPEVVVKIIDNLRFLLYDENVNVSKRAIGAMSFVYKSTLKWVSKLRHVQETAKNTWENVESIKAFVLSQLNIDNDGVRTATLRFMEMLAVILSHKSPDSITESNDFSLDQIPDDHRILIKPKLALQGQRVFEKLISFCLTQNISSANLIICMGSITNIAKLRPTRLASVVQTFESLHANLPHSFTSSQVLSVRKHLKMHLLTLLKHPCSFDYHANITTLLTDLGATQNEVMKCLCGMGRNNEKRKLSAAEGAVLDKKIKIDETLDDDVENSVAIQSAAPQELSQDKEQTCIDITAEDLISKLNTTNVVDLVLLSMMMLPDDMPASFLSTYTPIAAAGTSAQIKHLARLLATQLTSAGLGKGYEEMQLKAKVAALKTPKLSPKEFETEAKDVKPITSIVGVGREEDDGVSINVEGTEFTMPPPPVSHPVSTIKKPRAFKLTDVTKPLDYEEMRSLTTNAFHRILAAEEIAEKSYARAARRKIMTSLVIMSGKTYRDIYEDYIFADVKKRSDLAFDWLYQEYAQMMGFLSNSGLSSESSAGDTKKKSRDLSKYDDTLTRILESLQERPDQRDRLFSKVLLTAPYLTEMALAILKRYCQEESRAAVGMVTLKELILKRTPMRERALNSLLDFTHHENLEIRHNAIKMAKSLHENPDFKESIETYALKLLKFLPLPVPPAKLFVDKVRLSNSPEEWNEDSIRMCLLLYLSLMTTNHNLIHPLTSIYTTATGDVKRIILKLVDNPIRAMGIRSPELLKLVETCPKGAETMVTRIIHILTDRNIPSPELVQKVRDLYHKRVSDVRFLIPVLNGLEKNEIISVLPRLIKLAPAVVKEVFNRLLSINKSGENNRNPLSPSELLIALHKIDSTECDLKTIIAATGLCLVERNLYTQDVLAVTIQQLSEITPLPVLLMRTILQSIGIYPKLAPFVMKVLQSLITKQVWKFPKIWEGFIKCCQRSRPHCYQVVLLLPPPQFQEVLKAVPEIREGLLRYVNTLTSAQKTGISPLLLKILESDAPPVISDVTPDNENVQKIASHEPVVVSAQS